MKPTQSILTAFFCVATVAAQTASQPASPLDRPEYHPQALQEALDLTDDQIERLHSNNLAFRAASQSLFARLTEKLDEVQREVRDTETANVAVVGASLVASEKLRDEIEELRAEHRNLARAILTAEQLRALKPIEEAAAIARVVADAAFWNLVAIR